ncbi:uncharacterized protein LOC143211371 isoform X2 [Lasioglossum baleicum]|uniref:uncharacterized protein LOC143211371 isoform X2 n=1 Tax=Lasioglossum baleicum TaxID=434251 RepID=UPI003FCCD5E7
MMHQQEDKNKSLESCNITPDKLQRLLRSRESEGRDAHRSRTQTLKQTFDSTPRNSSHNQTRTRTPESHGSFRKDVSGGSGSSIQKGESVHHHENLEKIQKTCPKGKFVNTLIKQWSTHMGVQIPLMHTIESQENPQNDGTKRKLGMEEQKIQLLTKKLKSAEEAISSLSAARDAESLAKKEIFEQLNNDWVSITNYYSEISESLKGFKEHKDNLYKLYNNITVMQETVVKKLQQELNDIKLKDEDRKNMCAAVENKMIIQEKRMQEMMIAETALKKLLEDVKNESASEKNRLKQAHAEERVDLIKEQEKLTSVNAKLQGQLNNIIEEKQHLTELLKEKDKEISVLQQDISTFKTEIAGLLSQTADLNAKYEKSVVEADEFKKELGMKLQEINLLRENLNSRQEVETSLANDLKMIETKYTKTSNDFATIQNQLKNMEARNSALQNTIHNMTNKSEHQNMELIKKIEFLEKEKDNILNEKRVQIKNLQNSNKLTTEKHAAELAALKKDYDSKLYEMKYQNAVAQFNVTLNRMDEEAKIAEKHKAQEKQEHSNATRSIVEATVGESDKTHKIDNQAKTIKQYQSQAEKMLGTPKNIQKSQQTVTHKEQEDIYNFSTQKLSDTTEKVSYSMYVCMCRILLYFIVQDLEYNDNISGFLRSQRSQGKEHEDVTTTQKKNRIFKTRGTGLKQYTTTRRLMKK